MEQRISTSDEQRLTRAVEKAASLAAVNEAHERNQLLADQLRHEQVDRRFAKTAAQAFNKRLTVLTLQKTADEHKADSFQLVDPQKVYELLGGEPELEKAASAQMPEWTATFTPKTMDKAASVSSYSRPPYEDTVKLDTWLEHLESTLDKQAAAFSELSGVYERLDSDITVRADQLREELAKSANVFNVMTLGRIYGDRLNLLVPDQKFEKSAAVMPDNEICNKVARLLDDIDSRTAIGEFLVQYKEGLDEFGKTAADTGTMLERLGHMGKRADFEDKDLNMIADTALTAPIGIADTAVRGLQYVGGNVWGTAKSLLNNAREKYYAGRDLDVSPGRVLDAGFINDDRMRDRMMAWSDMTADPAFSVYPSAQLFQAVNKAMSTDLSLERADKREVLRATVGQLLAQNNRHSTADIAALASTLKALSSSQPTAAAQAAEAVGNLDKVRAPEKYTIGDISIEPSKFEGSPVLKDWVGRLDEYVKTRQKEAEEKEKEAEKEQKEVQKATKDKENAVRNLALYMTLKQNANSHLALDASGKLELRDANNNLLLSAAELNSAIQQSKATAKQLYDMIGPKAVSAAAGQNFRKLIP